MLRSVTEFRDARGIQYALEFILVVCVLAALAGAKNYREIATVAADIPQGMLRVLGRATVKVFPLFRLGCEEADGAWL